MATLLCILILYISWHYQGLAARAAITCLAQHSDTLITFTQCGHDLLNQPLHAYIAGHGLIN